MSSISEAPSSRALKQLNNRNNVADLYLRQRMEQMEREKNFYLSYLDKDRLDVTDFLKNLQKCDSDDLPQSKLIKEGWDSDDDLSDDTMYVRNRRPTHTAKTAPPRLRVRRHERRGADDDEDDDEDDMSLADHHPRRNIKTSVPTRRQMLAQRHAEDEWAKVSKYDRTETFLRKLRQDAARDHIDDLTSQISRRELTAYLLNKVRLHPGLARGGFWGGPDGDGGGWDGDGDEETWARARMDMVYPIKRLGNIASRFQRNDSGRNTPSSGEAGSSKWNRRSASRKRGGVEEDEERSRVTSSQRNQRQKSVFDITADDPPANILPRPAGMPDFNRARRDTLVDTARAFGFGVASVIVKAGKNSPTPQESTPSRPPTGPANRFSKAGLAERRRAERAAKAAKAPPPWHVNAATKQAPGQKDEARGTDMMRAIMQMKTRFRAKPLDDRVKDFMQEIDELKKGQHRMYTSMPN